MNIDEGGLERGARPVRLKAGTVRSVDTPLDIPSLQVAPARAISSSEILFPARAEDGQKVILAVPVPELQRQERFHERWTDDVRDSLEPPHPALEKTIRLGRTGDAIWRLTADLPGWTLGPLLRRVRSQGVDLPDAAVIALGQHLAAGLSALHEAGRVHGLVNVETVIIAEDGRPVLRGVPMAPGRDAERLAGLRLATPPELVAPEQLHVGASQPATDVYQLGLLLLTVAAGGNPFVRRHRSHTRAAISLRSASLPGLERLPESLRDMVSDALKLVPDERPTMEAFRQHLDEVARDVDVGAAMCETVELSRELLGASPSHPIPPPAGEVEQAVTALRSLLAPSVAPGSSPAAPGAGAIGTGAGARPASAIRPPPLIVPPPTPIVTPAPLTFGSLGPSVQPSGWSTPVVVVIAAICFVIGWLLPSPLSDGSAPTPDTTQLPSPPPKEPAAVIPPPPAQAPAVEAPEAGTAATPPAENPAAATTPSPAPTPSPAASAVEARKRAPTSASTARTAAPSAAAPVEAPAPVEAAPSTPEPKPEPTPAPTTPAPSTAPSPAEAPASAPPTP